MLLSHEPPAPPVPWFRVSALAVCELVAWGTLYYAFAVIMEPMGKETGWTRPEMNGAFSVGLGVCGLASFGVGRWIDRKGGRVPMAAGGVLGAGGLLLWSCVTSLWQLYAVFALIGLASSMVLYEAAFAATARMLPTGYRRAIIAITLAGGLASTAFIPLTHILSDVHGWRGALDRLAFIELGFCAVLAWLALPGSPALEGLTSARPSRMLILREVGIEPVFWLLLASYVSYALFYTALLFNILPILANRGFTINQAITLYSFIGPAQLAGRLCLFAADRILPVSIAGLAGTTLPVVAMLILMTADPKSLWPLLFPVLFGAGMGIKTVVQATAAPEFLGQSAYGALQGLLSMPVYIAQAVAPFLAAVIWNGSDEPAMLENVLLIAALASVIAFACAARLAPRRHAAPAAPGGK